MNVYICFIDKDCVGNIKLFCKMYGGFFIGMSLVIEYEIWILIL